MALSNTKIQEYKRRVLLSRMRILQNHSFFGLLLMHLTFGVDETEETAYTDGKRIVFGTNFLEDLNDSELDLVMLHEIMHIALQHCFRSNNNDSELWNEACDIVVNSNIYLENNMNKKSITLRKYGEAMHLAPNGQEGYKYSAEEVYKQLCKKVSKGQKKQDNKSSSGALRNVKIDNHSHWGESDDEDDDILSGLWINRISNAAKAVTLREDCKEAGSLPLLAERLLAELTNPKIDWRTILNEFIQEEITDYSFYPPDKRFNDFDFFLPDYNYKEEKVENILFMIDTSGSMDKKEITEVYSEVKGAIEQFNGKLEALLGFFDASVVEPKPFSSVDDLKIIRPKGGGGTRFDIIFEYVKEKMDVLPTCIIIMTDGYATFPEEEVNMQIPTLWIINNDEVTPPWGKIARL